MIIPLGFFKKTTSSSTELFTVACTSGNNETNSIDGDWNQGYYGSVETGDVSVGTYALKANGSGTYPIISREFTGLTIGDEITVSFWAKANTQNEQYVSLEGTDASPDDFWTIGSQPLSYALFSKTFLMTATTLKINISARSAGGVSSDYLFVDDLSVLKN